MHRERTPRPAERRRPRPADCAVAGSVALILLICLVPTSRDVAPIIRLCLICGTGGLASLVLNVLLYLPLGAALRIRFGSVGPALVAGFLLSLSIELTQLWIPGRFTTLADLVANTAGAGLGALLAVRPRAWLLPRTRTGNVLAAAWAAAATLAFVLPGALLSPSVPEGDLYAQWTPRLQSLEPYGGRLISARIGDLSLPQGLLEHQDQVRRLLRSGAPVDIRFSAGPPPSGLAPVLRLVAGPFGEGEEVLQVGVDRDDLVLRPRYRADDFRLTRPDLRLRGFLLAVADGDAVELAFRGDAEAGHRVVTGEGETVLLGVTAARGWSLLRYPARLPEAALDAVDLLWIAALLIPLGWWAARATSILIVAGAPPLAALALIPAWSVLLPTPLTHLFTGAASLLFGYALRSAATRLDERSSARHRWTAREES